MKSKCPKCGKLTDDDWLLWYDESQNVKAALYGKLDPSEVPEKYLKQYTSAAIALDKLSKSQILTIPKVYRGEQFDSEEQIFEKYPVHGTVRLENLTSASIDKETARKYARTNPFEIKDQIYKVLIEIANPSGIPGVQTFHLGVPTNEVILAGGKKYEVKNISIRNIGLDLGLYVVTLESVEKVNLPRVDCLYPIRKVFPP